MDIESKVPGAQGPQGSQGATGAQGAGSQGAQGAQGPQGAQGGGGGSSPYTGTGAFVVTNTWRLKNIDAALNSPVSGFATDGTNLYISMVTNFQVAKLDLNGALVAAWSMPEDPTNLHYAFGYLWMTSQGGDRLRLYKIDTSTGSVVSIYSSLRPLGAAITSNATYLFVGDRDLSIGDGVVFRFDPVAETFNDRVETPQTTLPEVLATDNTNLWVFDRATASVRRIDPATGATIGTVDVSASGLPMGAAGWTGGNAVFVAMNNGDLLKIDTSDTIVATYPSGASALSGCALDGAYVYVTETSPNDKIRVFSLSDSAFIDLRAAGNSGDDVAWDEGANVWCIDRSSQTIRRLDRVTGSLSGTIDVSASGYPRRGVYTAGYLWVAMDSGDFLKIDTSDSIVATYSQAAASAAVVVADVTYTAARIEREYEDD